MRIPLTILAAVAVLLPAALAAEAPARLAVALSDASPEEIAEAAARAGGEITFLHAGAGFAVVDVASPSRFTLPAHADMRGAGALLDGDLAGAASTDPYWGSQWGPQVLDMPNAWARETGERSVIVAVVDSGVDESHQDLRDVAFLPGTDYVDFDADPGDANGHGTHVAGVIAATRGNGVGMAGMADVTILPLRVLDENGSGSCLAMALAVVEAVDKGADVINLSLYCNGDYFPLRLATQYADAANVVVPTAAGNFQNSQPWRCVTYPAAYVWTLGVAAVESDLDVAPYSCQGYRVDVAAPGSAILSTLPGDRYASWYGTSMATPHVAGAAALLLSANPLLTANQVEALLKGTARDLGPAGRDNAFGYGLIQPVAALDAGALPVP